MAIITGREQNMPMKTPVSALACSLPFLMNTLKVAKTTAVDMA